MLIFDANVSLSSFLKCLVTVDAILINSGSCSLVSVLCIGHSDLGNSRKLGPFCQMLSKFISLGFLPRVNQSAMLYLLSIQNHSLEFVFCCISPTRVAAKVLNPYDSFCIMLCNIWESTMW